MNYTVKQGKMYSATIQLGMIERMASNETIRRKLLVAGFTSVQVTGAGKTRYAEAVWSKPTTTGPIPKQIIKIKEIT